MEEEEPQQKLQIPKKYFSSTVLVVSEGCWTPLGLRTASISQFFLQRYSASFTASFMKTAPWV